MLVDTKLETRQEVLLAGNTLSTSVCLASMASDINSFTVCDFLASKVGFFAKVVWRLAFK